MKLKSKDVKNIIPDLTAIEYVNEKEKAKLKLCRNVIAINSLTDNKMYLVIQHDEKITGLEFEEIRRVSFSRIHTSGNMMKIIPLIMAEAGIARLLQ